VYFVYSSHPLIVKLWLEAGMEHRVTEPY